MELLILMKYNDITPASPGWTPPGGGMLKCARLLKAHLTLFYQYAYYIRITNTLHMEVLWKQYLTKQLLKNQLI